MLRLAPDCRHAFAGIVGYPSNSLGDGARRARAWSRTRRAGRSAHSVIHPGSDASVVRPRDLTRGPGLGVHRCRNFLVADRRRRQDREHARFPRGLLGRWRGVRNRWLDGSPFRREERLGCPARARDLLTIVTARVVLFFPMIEQGSPRMFGYRDIEVKFVSFGKSLMHTLSCPFQVKRREAGDSGTGFTRLQPAI